MLSENKFKVSIRCMTYNHSAYITDAMNGFCMQQTNFPFLAIVMDDASTDGEQVVIEDYIKGSFLVPNISCKKWETEEAKWLFARHRENSNCYFLVVFLKRNMYKQKQAKLELIKEWEDKCKYIALCEGDDYWVNPLKLQKQVDYLENHIDCCMSTHAAYFDVKGELLKWGCQHEKECDLTPDEVIRNGGLYLATASLICRRVLLNDRPEWMKMADVGDYPLQILGTLRGTLHFFPEIMCVYRYQHLGSWTNNVMQSGLNLGHLKMEISWLTRLDEETSYQYSDAVSSHLISFYSALYRNKQVPFNDYYRVFKKVLNHSYKRLFRDVLIRNLYGLYGMYKKVNACKNS